jgi:hypothetical protein
MSILHMSAATMEAAQNRFQDVGEVWFGWVRPVLLLHRPMCLACKRRNSIAAKKYAMHIKYDPCERLNIMTCRVFGNRKNGICDIYEKRYVCII